MEWIILIGLIIFAMSMSSKRQSQKKRAAPRTMTTYTRTTTPPFGSVSITDILSDEDDAQALIQPIEIDYSPSFGSEGESFRGDDTYGCVGGSMAHDSHEGMEFEGHNHTLPARVYDLEQPIREPSKRTALTPAQMRNAVIMAEILGKPVSCRRR